MHLRKLTEATKLERRKGYIGQDSCFCASLLSFLCLTTLKNLFLFLSTSQERPEQKQDEICSTWQQF